MRPAPSNRRRWLAGVAVVALGLAWLGWLACGGGARQARTERGAPRPVADRADTAEFATAPPAAAAPDRKDAPPPGPPANPAPAAPELHPAPAAAPQPPASGEIADRVRLRLQVRWDDPGLCGPDDAQRVAARAALLRSFVPLDDALAAVRHDPSVKPIMLEILQITLPMAVGGVRRYGFEPPPFPAVYVYRDVQQLQSVSCANRAAIGYYDGAIHMSGDLKHTGIELQQTLIHEYVHHVLRARGVTLPTWLHEGLAMRIAGESWYLDPSLGLVEWLRAGHLPFDALAGAFPHAADEPFALAAYYQSEAMVGFVSHRRGRKIVVALVDELAAQRVAPAEAFAWAAGLSGQELEQAWAAYLASPDHNPGEPADDAGGAAEPGR